MIMKNIPGEEDFLCAYRTIPPSGDVFYLNFFVLLIFLHAMQAVCLRNDVPRSSSPHHW